MKRVFVQSFGCRASQSDGAAIEASLVERGYERAASAADAELIVVNTCTVTHRADVDARRLLRQYHRDAPDSEILVTGCYAQRQPEGLTQIEGVRWVVGNSHKTQIANIVSGSEDYHGRVWISDINQQREFLSPPVHDTREDRTRPNLKVQDGCGNKCSFCVIPSVRGRSRSARAEDVIVQIRDLSTRYAEVVLTGINLGRWGRDLPGRVRFVDLVRRILTETEIQHLRISSVEPMDWTEPLMQLIADEPRLAKHVHIPLQSGSDTVLRRMFRKYRTRHYATRLELAASAIPEVAIGADVMAGFPGETEAEFDETVRFIDQHPFTYLHVFTYSERPGTPAASSVHQVPPAVRKERTRILRELSDRKNEDFRRKMNGKTLRSVTLEQRGMALTTNFLRAEMAHDRPPNQLIDLTIGATGPDTLKERTE